MAKKKANITNAMRILRAAGIDFYQVEYETDEVGESFGEKIAELTGLPPEISFKTLVARGDKTGVMAVCVPVKCEVDLKKLAKESGNKKAELVSVKELLGLTGYIRGSVSPIGMKKEYPTYVDITAQFLEKMAVSGGRCGMTLLLSPIELQKVTKCRFCNICKTEES